jgi:hypothetical protein
MDRFALMFIFSCITTVSVAKTYEVTVEACEVGSSCSRCVERNKITFDVDASAKTVVANGVTVDGLAVREVMKDCSVQEENNWSCRSAFDTLFDVKNGVLNLSSKRKERPEGQHEVCRVEG